jgi:hypothetical protein
MSRVFAKTIGLKIHIISTAEEIDSVAGGRRPARRRVGARAFLGEVIRFAVKTCGKAMGTGCPRPVTDKDRWYQVVRRRGRSRNSAFPLLPKGEVFVPVSTWDSPV